MQTLHGFHMCFVGLSAKNVGFAWLVVQKCTDVWWLRCFELKINHCLLSKKYVLWLVEFCR